nr:HEAT repeat domain-containing protein [Acidobacteriota bacterium]
AEYSGWLAGRVGKVYVFGEEGARPLDKVFVTLDVVEERQRPSGHAEFLGLMDAEMRRRRDPFAGEDGGRGGGPGGSPRRSLRPDELLRAQTRAVITGAPGCGKTTLLKYLAWKTLEDGARLPVFLELKGVTEAAFARSENSLAGLLFEAAVAGPLRLTPTERERLRELFHGRLGAGGVAVFLDGLDEVRGADFFPRLRESVGEFLRSTHPDNSLLISTRPYALQARFEGLKQMEIAPLGDDQIEEFFAHYYGGDAATQNLLQSLRRRRPLREMLRVPFLLAVIARLHRETGGVAENRLELYRQIVWQLVVQLDREKSVVRPEFRVPDRNGALKLDFLRQLAFERLLQDEVGAEGARLVFTGEEILSKARQFWERARPPEGSPYDLAEDVKATPLLREVGADAYAFSHLTIQEYLAASALAQRRDCERLFCRAYFNPTLAEMEVLPMTLGLVAKPERLHAALEQLPESLTFAGLRLRARSLAYTPDLDRRTLTVLTDRLGQFLRRQNQEEAPYVYILTESFSAAAGKARELVEDYLLTLLESSDTGRVDAARALSGLGSRRAVPPMITALKSQDADLRHAAIAALGQIGDDRALPHLLEAAKEGEDDLASWFAIDALANFKDARVVPVLQGLLKDANTLLRQPVVEALKKLGHLQAAVAFLIEAVRDTDWETRMHAAEALRYVNDERVVPPLIEALRDIDSLVRYYAADALGRQGDERAVDALIGALRGKDGLGGPAALEALWKIGGEKAIAAIAGALESTDTQLANTAASVLAERGDARAVDHLLDALLSPERRDWRVVSAFQSVKDRRAFGPLLNLLKDKKESASIRKWAARALGHFGDAAAAPALAAALGEAQADIHEAAVEALGKIGGEGVVAPLLGALRNGSPLVSWNAATALGKFEDTVLREGLTLALAHGDAFVRQRAARAVGYYADSRGLLDELSRLASNDEAEEVRAGAGEARARFERKLSYFS